MIINDQWKRILPVLLDADNKNCTFITGEAGSGKTTLLRYVVDKLSEKFNVAIVAPTGVAALNAGGVTAHSFFGLPITVVTEDDIKTSSQKRDLFRAIDVIVFDEVAAMRADVMDGASWSLQKNRGNSKPFGGVKVIMFGDLYQLAPIVQQDKEKEYLSLIYGVENPFFYKALVFKNFPIETHQLTQIYRQTDQTFVDTLNRVRLGKVAQIDLDVLNTRVMPNFKPDYKEWVTLTTTNAIADTVNKVVFDSILTQAKEFTATISGDFNLKNSPVKELIYLKIGLPVMFTRNSELGDYVNGTRGIVTNLDPLKVMVGVSEITVNEAKWQQFEYAVVGGKLKKWVRGELSQIPIKECSGITTHKSQGLTLEKGVIDFGNGAFASAQTYVALSRFTSLEGIVLRKPLKFSDIKVSLQAREFFDNLAGEDQDRDFDFEWSQF